MFFKSFIIGGYKAYPNETKIDIRPLTLFYGENSSGKSSLMRLLPLIKQSILHPKDSNPFKLNTSITKSATIGDLFSKFRDKNSLSVQLEFESESNNLILKYDFHIFDRDTAILVNFCAVDKTREINVELDVREVKSLNLLKGRERTYVVKNSQQPFDGLFFDGFIPNFEANKEPDPTVTEFLKLQKSSLLGLDRIHWLGPLRSPIPRIERLNSSVTRIGENGEGASQILFNEFMLGGVVFKDVSEWFEKYCGVSLTVVAGAHEFGALASLALVRSEPIPIRIPLEDAGEGMSQVLPVLTLAAMAAHGQLGYDPVIIIEHPDLHLHSNAHYAVVDYLVECLKSKYRPRFMIESHSESVLTSAQLSLIDKNLEPGQFLAYHIVSEVSGAASANMVELDEHGDAVDKKYLALDWFSIANRKTVELARKKIAI